MILQLLCEYYERKSMRGEIAPMGFEWKPIPFLIIIDLDGKLKSLKDTREKEGKKLVAKQYLVPKSVGRSGSGAWKTTFLLWDHFGYVLGYPKMDGEKDRKKRHGLLEVINSTVKNIILSEYVAKKTLLGLCRVDDIELMQSNLEGLQSESPSNHITTLQKELKKFLKEVTDCEKQQNTFVRSIEKLPDFLQAEPSIQAIHKFYDLKQYEKTFELENWMDCAGVNGTNLTFQIEGESSLVVGHDVIVEYQKEMSAMPESSSEKPALCLVTGKQDYIERLHGATPILGGQATGKLVGFQKNSGVDSYGKEQAFNAPVGRYAQVAYTTALNTLTKSESNRVILGDTTIVFWSEQDNGLEQSLSCLFMKPKDDPDKGIGAIRQLYESLFTGKLNEEAQKRFFVLGIAPNAARVSVRFWINGTVGEISIHIKQHFEDLEIVHSEKDAEFYALSSLLSHTALDYKMANVTTNLFSLVAEAALQGTPYPLTLLHSTIRRIRAEQHITRTRAAIIKACINRHNRFYHKTEEEITVSLDKSNMNQAYLLGRLFAVLERVQHNALGIDTIRERYYGAFSSTPVTVYPQLMKLKNHHLAKLEGGGKYFYENLIGEIIDGFPGSGDIPQQLSLNNQGRFAVGYYHQRQDLFKGKTSKNKEQSTQEN